MGDHSSGDSYMSIDSLEQSQHKQDVDNKSSLETILVPFYEKDVLIRVPKHLPKTTYRNDKNHIKIGKFGREELPTNYLVNKDRNNKRTPSYLEKFRKQFYAEKAIPLKNEADCRSLSPQCGDTDRESIGNSTNNQDEFYGTEAYNAIYYEKLLNEEIERERDKLISLSPQENDVKFSKEFENLRSVSEVSHRRTRKKITTEPAINVQLGGLGPDLELIKPRLERARSLQRYSERVRMANRVKIYNRKAQEEAENKGVQDKSSNNSYLVNKNPKEKTKFNIIKSKSDSQNKQETREKQNIQTKREPQMNSQERKDNINKEIKTQASKQTKDINNRNSAVEKPKRPRTVTEKIKGKADVVIEKLKVKSGVKNLPVEAQVVTQENKEFPSMQINFLVNVGNYRPSSTLRSLEEKHRQFQEQLKAMSLHD